MAQMVNPSRHADLGVGVAPLDRQGGEATVPVPVLDTVLPIADSVLADFESRRFGRRRIEESEAIDIDLDLAEEMLANAVAQDSGATHVDSVRAQLGSIVHGLAAPPPKPAPPITPPIVTAPVASPVVRPDVRAEASERMNRQLARRVVDLTLRAEAAETKLRTLEAQVATEQSTMSALGRRFGQLAHESFPVFVARLGMSAKLRQAERNKSDKGDKTDRPEPTDGDDR